MDDGVKFHGSYVLKRCHNNVFFADRLIYPFIGMMKDIDFDAIDFSTDTSFRNEMSGKIEFMCQDLFNGVYVKGFFGEKVQVNADAMSNL